MIKYLAYLNPRIDPNGLNTEHFQCPIAIKAYISKSCGDMDKQPKSANGRSSLQHRHQVFRSCPFNGSAKVERASFQ